MQEVSIHWFRRDLRLADNAGLYHALTSGYPVLPVFIFDTNILEELKDEKLTSDKRVEFIYREVNRLKAELNDFGGDLVVYHSKPLDVWKKIVKEYNVRTVFTNHDYEPYAIQRDKEVKEFLQSKEISFITYKDQVIFEKSEVVKDDGSPYTVYTPYSRKWKATLSNKDLEVHKSANHTASFYKTEKIQKLISLEEMGFQSSDTKFPGKELSKAFLKDYPVSRDIPSIHGTSRIGIHLRFGTISIRQLVNKAMEVNAEKYLNELIWREFYMMILFHFPQVVEHSFRPEYDRINWRNNEKEFEAWCKGKTGYHIVDAGMRELNETGFMHNRVRMITASFLTKHLLIDWRWGEAYFAKKLLDYELASNNGGWQWAAGTGVDAAPYFRIFNPTLQTKKFDPELKYIRKWIPELETVEYPTPIIEHTVARERCLAAFQKALK